MNKFEKETVPSRQNNPVQSKKKYSKLVAGLKYSVYKSVATNPKLYLNKNRLQEFSIFNPPLKSISFCSMPQEDISKDTNLLFGISNIARHCEQISF